jgi:hypothetical protein
MERWLWLMLSLAVVGDYPPAPLAPPQLPPAWSFTLPAGSAVAGERAFVKMECYSCHTVAGKRFGSPGQNPGGIGPELTGALARLPREYLAESIIHRDRHIAHGRRQQRFVGQDGSSRMAGYDELLTVRELIDLVAFLQSVQ